MGERLWTCVATCQVCGVELNRAEHVPERSKMGVVFSAPLNCICKVKEHNTFSDCNVGVKLEWTEEAEQKKRASFWQLENDADTGCDR